MDNSKTIRSLFPIILTLALLPSSLYGAPTEKNFRQDMAYYYKAAKTKKLGANDRLYILDRFRGKYRDVDFDLSELYAEIDRWYGAKQKEQKVKKPAPKTDAPFKPSAIPVAPTSMEQQSKIPAEEEPVEGSGTLTKALVTEGKGFSRLALDIPGTEKYKDILKKDEKGVQPPVLIIYLYQTLEKLKPTSKNFGIKTGLIRQVQSSQVSKNPPTIRVAVSLRGNYPYQISKNDDQLILTISKDKSGFKPAPAEKDPEDLTGESPVDPNALPEGAAVGEKASTELVSLLPVSENLEEADVALIGKGDILSIKVWPAEEFSQSKVVQSDGTIQMSLVGRLRVVGLSILQVERQILEKLSDFVPNPKVKISIRKFTPKQIFLTGQVKSPGAYEYIKPLGCFEFILKTGGFLSDADKRSVVIYRGNKDKRTLLIFDVEDFLASVDPSKDIPLEPGDVIEVYRATNYVYVVGAVKQQGRYDFQEGMKLVQTIYSAGGFEANARLDEVRVIREEQERKMVYEVNMKEVLNKRPEKDLLLKAGDLVIVPQKGAMKGKFFTRGVLSWIGFFISLGLVLGLLV